MNMPQGCDSEYIIVMNISNIVRHLTAPAYWYADTIFGVISISPSLKPVGIEQFIGGTYSIFGLLISGTLVLVLVFVTVEDGAETEAYVAGGTACVAGLAIGYCSVLVWCFWSVVSLFL